MCRFILPVEPSGSLVRWPVNRCQQSCNGHTHHDDLDDHGSEAGHATRIGAVDVGDAGDETQAHDADGAPVGRREPPRPARLTLRLDGRNEEQNAHHEVVEICRRLHPQRAPATPRFAQRQDHSRHPRHTSSQRIHAWKYSGSHMAHDVVAWLLDADPAIRWQVMRDLTDTASEEVARERARVVTDGWGAHLLSLQAPDGRWGGAAWNHGWDSTMHVLWLLRDFGIDPMAPEVRHAVDLVRTHVTWRDCGPEGTEDNGFFDGETEPCINGQVAAIGAWFGQDVRPLIDRLLGEQLADGGWNCDAERGSTRSSFNSTICVLDALLEYEQRIGPDDNVAAVRRRGEEYLLERGLFRRKSTGEAIVCDRKRGGNWTQFAFPTWWHYDILRGLDYFRRAGDRPDARLREAIAIVESQCDSDGRWRTGTRHPGSMMIDVDAEVGAPSRWITLRARRVLRWWQQA